MKKRYLLLALLSASPAVQSACQCACVNGAMVPLCTSTTDVVPICPASVCSLPSPEVPPISVPIVPPIGTTVCNDMQVEMDDTFVWLPVCY